VIVSVTTDRSNIAAAAQLHGHLDVVRDVIQLALREVLIFTYQWFLIIYVKATIEDFTTALLNLLTAAAAGAVLVTEILDKEYRAAAVTLHA
jgi:hypothetical protein